MILYGQMQDCNPWHPLDHGIFAMVLVGMHAPIGNGTQKMIIHAVTLMSKKKKTPCHHFAPGSKLPPPFSSSLFQRKSYVSNRGSDLQLLPDKDNASSLPVPKMDDCFWLDKLFQCKLLEHSLLRESNRQKEEDVLFGLLWLSLPLVLVVMSVPSDSRRLDSSDISSRHEEVHIIASEVTPVQCVMGKSLVCMRRCMMGNVLEDASGFSVRPWALCCVVLLS
jgi:hypothetical protein